MACKFADCLFCVDSGCHAGVLENNTLVCYEKGKMPKMMYEYIITAANRDGCDDYNRLILHSKFEAGRSFPLWLIIMFLLGEIFYNVYMECKH